ncbi:MAG: SipW-dependent-type signal peptide-containing protein [Clostridia bacterium]|nr:SipW-dependent-type signal peptide-containing protein [Clostridia bacterium]
MKKNSTKKALLMSVLSLLLCISMLIGTTYAWFTDTVTSAGNIIKAGTLDVELTYADGSEDPATATFADASTGAIFNYELWEPGYTEVKHLGIANVGTLALKYQMRILANGVVSKLADVIDVYYYDTATKLTRDNYATAGVKLGTLTEVLTNNYIDDNGEIQDSAKSLSNTIKGTLLAGESKTVTLALHMQESAGNEYQGLSIGTDFSVQLLATQYTYEEDSFDDQYDKNADFAPQKTPSPMINELPTEEISYTLGIGGSEESMTLDSAYQYRPTETLSQAEQSDYRWHHADFVVSADADVPAESIALAGFYNVWCNGFNNGNWVALTSPDPINAGSEIRLVKSMSDMMSGATITVSYDDLCEYGNDGTGFLCGVKALKPEEVAGTTISVELRLYKTECSTPGCHHNNYGCETGEYISAGVTKYTFPAVEVSTAAELKDALADGISSIALSDDVVVDSTLDVPATADVTLDLNGNNLSYAVANSSASAIINNKGTLEIVGEGEISFVAANPDLGAIPAYATNTITNTGVLTIGEGVVVSNASEGGASYAVDNHAKFTLNGGTLIGNRCALRVAKYNPPEVEFIMNSGLVEAKTPAWIQLAGSNANTAPSIKVTINGGTFKSTKASSADNNVLYTYSFGNSHANTSITINDGEFLGGTVSIGSGYKGDAPALTINGGTFEYDVLQWLAGDTSNVLYAANK